MDNLAAFSNAAGTGEGLSIAEIYARAKQDLALSDIKKIKDMESGLQGSGYSEPPKAQRSFNACLMDKYE